MKHTGDPGWIPIMYLFIGVSMMVELIGWALMTLLSWMITFQSMVEHRVWMVGYFLLFHFFLPKTILNCLLPLSMKEAMVSVQETHHVLGVLSIIWTGQSLPITLLVGPIFGMLVEFYFRFS